MSDAKPAWYGDIEPQYRCDDCGHEMFETVRDEDAGVEFCPKCGQQTVMEWAQRHDQAEDRG